MKRFLCGLAVLGVFIGIMGQARSDFIYWADASGGEIRRANLDGSGQTILVKGLTNPNGPALDLADGQMYWGIGIFGGDIRRANLDGSGQTTLISGVSHPGVPALDLGGGRIYWNDVGNIQRRISTVPTRQPSSGG
jgi:hypothetical protein